MDHRIITHDIFDPLIGNTRIIIRRHVKKKSIGTSTMECYQQQPTSLFRCFRSPPTRLWLYKKIEIVKPPNKLAIADYKKNNLAS